VTAIAEHDTVVERSIDRQAGLNLLVACEHKEAARSSDDDDERDRPQMIAVCYEITDSGSNGGDVRRTKLYI
jgi:hypothetical protein